MYIVHKQIFILLYKCKSWNVYTFLFLLFSIRSFCGVFKYFKNFLYFLSICKIANNRNTFCCFFISRYLFVLKALFQIDIFIVQEYFFHSYNLFTESFYDYVDGFRKFGNEIYDGSIYDMIGCNEI